MLLARIKPELDIGLPDFVRAFFSDPDQAPHSAESLQRLAPAELEELQLRQAQHLALILSADSTPQTRQTEATRLGRAHELSGISPPVLTRSYELYLTRIRALIGKSGLSAPERDQLSAHVAMRLMRDISDQLEAQIAVQMEVATLFASLDRIIQETSKLPDLLNKLMEAFVSMDGLIACLFSRPDAHGAMQIEAYGGAAGRTYAETLQSGRAPMFHTSAQDAAGRGPAGRAWRSGQIQITEIATMNIEAYPWRDVGRKLGFRSSAGVPLLEEAGQPFAILSLYSSWPGFFGSPNRLLMLEHIQQATSHAVRRSEQNKVIPVSTRRAAQQLVADGAVEMHYQPIVDLRSGRLAHVEALARLRQPNGQLLAPAAFLPALGQNGLLRLFQTGLQQVCEDLTTWQCLSPALRIHAAINLPSDGLIDDAYRDCIFETLARFSLAPSRIELEVLETPDAGDLDKRETRIRELRDAGVPIVQDDLGSGYSSLLRLDRMPFDAVKIDQGLVRSALEKPWRALGFIYHLTRLADDFAIPVTVEGLEDHGLIEAAAILGATCGQGYGIARPMPASDLPAWVAQWAPSIKVNRPRTAIGALACFLLWDRHLAAAQHMREGSSHSVTQADAVLAFIEETTLPAGDLPKLLARHQDNARLGALDPRFRATQLEIIDRLTELRRDELKA